jgi:hypothetical protein
MFLQFYGDLLGVDKDIESQVTYQDNIAHNVIQLIGRESLFHYGPGIGPYNSPILGNCQG